MNLAEAYKILEIDESASFAEVKQSYKDLAAVWHPDRHSHNSRLAEKALQKMKELNAAYSLLSAHYSEVKSQKQTYQNNDNVKIVICSQCGSPNRIQPLSNVNFKCGKCHANLFADNFNKQDSKRVSCGDGECTGIIRNGRCTVCGKTLEEGRREDERKTKIDDEIFKKHNNYKDTKKGRISYVVVLSAIFTIYFIAFYNSFNDDDTQSNKRPITTKQTFNEIALPIPYNGFTRIHTPNEQIAPFEINTSAGSNYLVKLQDVSSGVNVIDIFIHGGQKVETNVPIGRYIVKYASGNTWYGYQYYFGPDTIYSKADAVFDFNYEGNHISGYTVTLYRVPGGNLATHNITPSEF